MNDAKTMNAIAIDVFNDPESINTLNLNSSELSEISRNLYNISKTNLEGRIFLKQIKESAISFNEKEGLDIEPSSMEKASYKLWYGHTGKEGLYQIINSKDLNFKKAVNIDDVLSKKVKKTNLDYKKVSSVSDLIKNAQRQAVLDNKSDSIDRSKER